MEDIFGDKGFDNFLYGGIHDLDEPVGMVVYDLYRSKLVTTTWSCSGHIAPWLNNKSGYALGILRWNENPNNPASKIYNAATKELTLQHQPFASWRVLEGKADFIEIVGRYCIELNIPGLERVPDLQNKYIPHSYEGKELAEQGYVGFLKFWKDLHTLTLELIAQSKIILPKLPKKGSFNCLPQKMFD